LKEGISQLEFLGKTVKLSPNTGIFVTLNPAGRGYGGRSKLPDNLKQLFRCVCVGAGCSLLAGSVNASWLLV